ncbi:MAG TPA: lipopolysaccharide kinase InaA family protein [Polyangiaceae bacterium]|nr:lipopolysaccharide kinase InaA family protein [Polyangiaceae bacterium]
MRIRSEHAVRVLDEGLLDDATPYLVVEQVEGQTLAAIIARWGRLPVTTAVDCVLQAMEAVAQAHSFGIVHGDLNVSKMFVTRRPDRSWCIKVDFSQRKVAPPSHSGEFLIADRPDVSTDVRALGAVLHVLLTGASPCGGTVHPSVPRALGEVVQRSLQLGPRAGYASVSQLARVLTPFGTAAARVSCERIECLLDDRVTELTKPPLHPVAPVEPPSRETDLDLDVDPRAFGLPASGGVVFPALAMLAALGAIVFATLYMSVPRSQPASASAAAHTTGVAEMQAR